MYEMKQGRHHIIGTAIVAWAVVSLGMARAGGNYEPGLTLAPADTSAPGGGGASQEADASDLAKKTQNPVSDLISVPFQSNFNFGVGPDDDMQYVLNIQPVIPVKISEDWNLINRTIVPLIYQPTLAPGVGDEFGLGDIQYQGYFSPRNPGKWIWGAGPILTFPTASDDSLGSEEWSAGPGLVALTMPGHWVVGGLINNVWSYGGWGDQDVNQMLIQPIINYNLPKGWYLTSVPIITANWEASSDDRWTVPVGGGGGKVFTIGKQPINTQLQAFFNVESPDAAGADWQLRFQFQLLFPK